jgi:hypothetical protein
MGHRQQACEFLLQRLRFDEVIARNHPISGLNSLVRLKLGVKFLHPNAIGRYNKNLMPEFYAISKGLTGEAIMCPIRQLTPTQGLTWLDEFITGLKRADLSPRTVAGYQDDLVRFLHWFRHAKRLRAI